MNILVTGATGYIGTNLVRKLTADNYQVFVTIRPGKPNPFDSGIVPLYFGDEKADCIIQFLQRNKIEGIMHLAAVAKPTQSNSETAGIIDANVKFGSLLLEYAVAAGVKWFINTGSFWQHYQNKIYSPVNLYAATKQAFETVAQYYVETGKIKFVTVLLNDTYGSDDHRDKIFNLWNRIARTGEILEMTEGKQIIDITHIDDVVNAYRTLILQLSNGTESIVNGSRFAVMADKRYELRELADIFGEVTGKKLNIRWGAKPYREREVMSPWSNGIPVPCWRPEITIQEGIRRIFEKERDKFLLSICIPTFNRALSLSIALEKLLPQVDNFNKEIQVIISDNGSTDNTPDVIAQTVKKYPTISFSLNRFSENTGFFGNFLQCRTMATGRYIWILSDNDHIDNEVLIETIVQLLRGCTLSSVYLNTIYKSPGPLYVEKIPAEILVQRFSCLLTMISAVIFNNDKSDDDFIVRNYDQNAFLGFLFFVAVTGPEASTAVISGHCYIDYVQKHGGFDYFDIFVNHQLATLDFLKLKGMKPKTMRIFKNRIIDHHIKLPYLKIKLYGRIAPDINNKLSLKEINSLLLRRFGLILNFWKYIFPLMATPGFIARFLSRTRKKVLHIPHIAG